RSSAKFTDRFPGPVRELSHYRCLLSISPNSSQFLSRDTAVLARPCGCGERENRISCGAPSSPGPFEVGERDDALVAAVAGDGVLSALPVPAGGSERAHGGGVAPALGGEVAAVSEHVRPAPQGLEVLVRMPADLE